MNHSSFLYHFFESFCPMNSALVTSEGDVLHVRTDKALHAATLGVAANTVMKYLPLKPGEVALLNDPYSGGSTLNEFTFVTKLLEGPLSVWLAIRSKKTDSLTPCKTVEEEGLRIPPTPIFQNGQMNTIILQAMGMHPLCPAQFTEWLQSICMDMKELSSQFQQMVRQQKINLSKNSLKEYLDESYKTVHEKILEAASGESKVEIALDTNEVIRLRMEINEGKVLMDFAGTASSQSHLLTESATYGICLYSLADFYNFTPLINAGSFSVLQIIKPTTCLLNAKYPAPIGAGAVSVRAALQTLIAMALNEIHAKKKKALSAYCPIELLLQSADGRTLALQLPGGSGAATEDSETPFACGEKLCESFSIEQTERDWPVLFQRADYRRTQTTKAETTVGKGFSLKFTAREPVTVQWRTNLTQNKLKLPRHNTPGDKAEISVTRSTDLQTQLLPSVGSLHLAAGDAFSLQSGTGSICS